MASDDGEDHGPGVFTPDMPEGGYLTCLGIVAACAVIIFGVTKCGDYMDARSAAHHVSVRPADGKGLKRLTPTTGMDFQ